MLLTLPPTAPRGSTGAQSSLLRPGTSGLAVRRRAGDRVSRRRGCVRTSGCDGGAGALRKPNYRLQGAPQNSRGEPDQKAARSQRATAPTASRSRWPPWGDWPGTERDILGVTGRHVGMGREQAGPRAHPSGLAASSISLKRQPSTPPSPARNSSVAAHHPLNRGQNTTALHSKSFPGWPQATSQTHLLPVPSRTLCSSQMDLLFCKQALQSVPHPHAFVHTFHLSGNVLPPQSPPPSLSCLSLPTLKADTTSSRYSLIPSYSDPTFPLPMALHLTLQRLTASCLFGDGPCPPLYPLSRGCARQSTGTRRDRTLCL